jgi:hypothetical protein
MKQVRFGVWCALLMASTAVNAADEAAPPQDFGKRGGFLAQLDFDYGGDDVAEVFFEDGESQNVKAGQGMTVAIGGYFRPMADSSLELQASFGYKFSTTAAENADIGVERTLLQAGAAYRWPNGFYLGGGLVQHLGQTLDGDGFFDDIDFDDATGFNFEIGWKWIALHYTEMTYESDLYEDVDASNIGVRFTYRYGAP